MQNSDLSSMVGGLIAPDRIPELGPGHPNNQAREDLESLTIERIF
jgi:hypothetical protein